MQDFKKLRVWQKAQQYALDVYKNTMGFPDSERFGIVQQLREASVSIPTNLAEGSSRRGDAEFRRFVFISMGSASETESLLLLSRDLGFIDGRACERLTTCVEEVRAMLCRLVDRLSSSVKQGSRH